MSVEVDEPSTDVEFPSDEEDDADEADLEDDAPEDEEDIELESRISHLERKLRSESMNRIRKFPRRKTNR